MSTHGPPGDLGTKLRDARERKGVSLRQIANSTKIAVGVLEALERNDISRLPGGIFGRAFVRAFAHEVGLDPELTIQEFLAQFPRDSVTAGHPASAQIENDQALESNRRMAKTFLRVVAAAGILVAGIVAYFSLAARREPAATIARALDVSTRQAAPVEPQAVPTSIPVTSIPAAVTPPPADQPRIESAAVAPDRLVIGLSATRRCWVSAIVDGQKQIAHILEVGEQRAIEVHRDLVLTAGDAGALAMTINGVDARSLGKAGQVTTARLDLENFKTYLPAP